MNTPLRVATWDAQFTGIGCLEARTQLLVRGNGGDGLTRVTPVQDVRVGDLIRTTAGPDGAWTRVTDIHTFFSEAEALVALPPADCRAVIVTRWHQVKQEHTSNYLPAEQVPEGIRFPPTPCFVFDLVTQGDLPIEGSGWALASAMPDDDPTTELTESCLPVGTLCDLLSGLWTPPPDDLLLQKCQLYAGLLMAETNGIGIIARVGALRIHHLPSLVAFLFPGTYSTTWDPLLVVRNLRRPHLLLQDANRMGDRRQFKRLLKGQCPMGQVADVAGFLAFHIRYDTTPWRAYCAGPGCARRIRKSVSNLWEMDLDEIPGAPFCSQQCARRAVNVP